MKKTALLISLSILLFLSFSCVCAEDNITDSIDEKTFAAIQQTIDNSSESSTIELDGNYYGNSTAININKSVTIKSNSRASINAGEKSQIFIVSADDVVFENLEFVRGSTDYYRGSEYGGAIYARGNNLKIINCSFVNNFARYGGAIASFGENVSIINCQFSSNTAEYSGGAVELDGNNNYLSECIFKNNGAGHVGSAVAWVGSNGILSNSTFDNSKIALSKSPQFGGAVVWMGNNGTLTKSTFRNFKAKKSGAAIYWKGGNGLLKYCIIENNNSTKDKAFYGNQETIGPNYWGENFKSGDGFNEKNLICFNDEFVAPKNWVNINEYKNSINFTLNDGSPLDEYLPDYGYGNVIIVNNSYIIKKSSQLTSSNLITYSLSNGKYLKITLKSGNELLSNKTIQINLNGRTYNKITNRNGVVTLQIKSKNPGVYNTYLSFKGDKWYNSSSKTVKITVKKQKPKLTASVKNKFIKVVLKDQFNKAMSKKLLKLTVNGKTYKVKTNSKGVANIKLNLKAKKTYNYKVSFAGNKYYSSASKFGKIKVK